MTENTCRKVNTVFAIKVKGFEFQVKRHQRKVLRLYFSRYYQYIQTKQENQKEEKQQWQRPAVGSTVNTVVILASTDIFYFYYLWPHFALLFGELHAQQKKHVYVFQYTSRCASQFKVQCSQRKVLHLIRYTNLINSFSIEYLLAHYFKMSISLYMAPFCIIILRNACITEKTCLHVLFINVFELQVQRPQRKVLRLLYLVIRDYMEVMSTD